MDSRRRRRLRVPDGSRRHRPLAPLLEPRRRRPLLHDLLRGAGARAARAGATSASSATCCRRRRPHAPPRRRRPTARTPRRRSVPARRAGSRLPRLTGRRPSRSLREPRSRPRTCPFRSSCRADPSGPLAPSRPPGGLRPHRRPGRPPDAGRPCLLLRTTGRRTGKSRTSALVYARDGAEYVVVASLGGSDHPPAWLHNVRADPQVGVQVGRKRFPATATIVAW